MTPDESDQAFELVKRPDFWCRARLFHALRAAQQSGVLEEVLDEMDIPAHTKERIHQHLELYWWTYKEGSIAGPADRRRKLRDDSKPGPLEL